MSRRVVVIGGGLNGLTAAAVLARRGHAVTVLERRAVLGGTHAVEEIFPGVRAAAVRDRAGWLPPAIARELELVKHGLTVGAPSPLTALLPDGGTLSLPADPARAADAIRPHSAKDAAAWPEFCRRLHALTSFLATLYLQPPPRLTSTSPRDLLSLLGLGRRARGLGDEGMIDLLRILPMSMDELLGDWFESDALKAALGAEAVRGIRQGPRSGGTAFVFLHHHAGAPLGAFGAGAHGAIHGGPGALVDALVASAKAAGVTARAGAEVRAVRIADGRVRGVTLASGEDVDADLVLSTADARETFLRLVDPAELDPEFLRAVENVRLRGVQARMHLRVKPGAGSGKAGESFSVVPSLTDLERAYDDAKHGVCSAAERMWLEATWSAPDVLSVTAQFAPHDLRGGWSDAAARSLGDAIVARLTAAMPELGGAIADRKVLSPADLERGYGAPGGSVYDGEMGLDQILFMRPVAGWAHYRAPIDGLWMGGAATHPGGGIAGAAGWNAARAIG